MTDTVYRLLREGIVNGTLPAGSKVNVDEITRSLDVSRTPVHEALAALASDGLVEVHPRRGTFVTEFTAEDYAETLDIRRALELLACETACENASEVDIAALEGLMRDMEASVREGAEAGEAARVHDAKNLEFHRRIVQLSGNKRLIDMYEDLRAHMRIARAHVDATAWLGRVPTEAAEHSEIVRALKKRDVAAMKSALDAHLRRSSASLTADMTKGGA